MPISPARPKYLATNIVACPWASELSIHSRQGRSMQVLLQLLRNTRYPLQLIFEFQARASIFFRLSLLLLLPFSSHKFTQCCNLFSAPLCLVVAIPRSIQSRSLEHAKTLKHHILEAQFFNNVSNMRTIFLSVVIRWWTVRHNRYPTGMRHNIARSDQRSLIE